MDTLDRSLVPDEEKAAEFTPVSVHLEPGFASSVGLRSSAP